MLRPTSQAPNRAANDGGDETFTPVEPRSFAPPEAARDLWPASWETMTPERAIPAPDAPEGRARDVVVVTSFNEGPSIAGSIAAFLDDESLVDPLVLVVDIGSTDGSAEIVSWIAARDPRVRLVQG